MVEHTLESANSWSITTSADPRPPSDSGRAGPGKSEGCTASNHYHKLLDKDANRSGVVPVPGSLYDDAQALMFGGSDTTGNTPMLGAFYLLENPGLFKRLKEELYEHWPKLEKVPPFEDLEKFPFLTAAIKESLPISPGVASPLLRVVPASGARIDGFQVPPYAVVGMSSVFVHSSKEIFEDALKFNPIADPKESQRTSRNG